MSLVPPAPRAVGRGLAEHHEEVQLGIADGSAFYLEEHALQLPDRFSLRVAELAQSNPHEVQACPLLRDAHRLQRDAQPLSRDEVPVETLFAVE